ncbi:hypothetical protein [Streptomyces sp. NPDC056061]|uniref:hypothetical protein n=1 Tax=Streptomyces sp. NPDC056061 TaxID=3345700 RepID=UPI0035E20912
MSFPFPNDLIDLKRQQLSTYHRLTQPAPDTARLRRELIRLIRLIDSHPYWQGGWSTAGRMELHHAATAARPADREPGTSPVVSVPGARLQ